MSDDKVLVSRSALLSVLLFVGALQQTETTDAATIADLQAQLATAKANAGIDDPAIDAQLATIAANAAAQPAATVVATTAVQASAGAAENTPVAPTA